MTETLDDTARRIADRGRDALLAGLRPAFEQAAAAHADVLQLDSDQLERMVQRAADRADGVQWRRALSSVATEELGIGLAEALSHPAVARAHETVGAPSYEESLAELLAKEGRTANAEPASRATEALPAPVSEGAAVTAEPASRATEALPGPQSGDADVPPAPAPVAVPAPPAQPAPSPPENPAAGVAAAQVKPAPAPAATQPGVRPEVRIAAVHLSGIANLAPSESDLELRLSGEGFDIVHAGGVVFGRLAWEDIRSLDVADTRTRRLRRRQGGAQLVVRSDRGDANFEIPGLTPEELRVQLAPLLSRR